MLVEGLGLNDMPAVLQHHKFGVWVGFIPEPNLESLFFILWAVFNSADWRAFLAADTNADVTTWKFLFTRVLARFSVANL